MQRIHDHRLQANEEPSYFSSLGDLLSERVYDANHVTRRGNLDVYQSAWNPYGQLDDNGAETNKQEIALCHIYTLLPFSNGQKETWNNLWGTMESTFALALAVQHLNTGNGTIISEVEGLNEQCPIRFSLELSDTELAARLGVRNMINAMARKDKLANNNNNNKDEDGVCYQVCPGSDQNETAMSSGENIFNNNTQQHQEQQPERRPNPGQQDNHQNDLEDVSPCFFLGAARSAVSIPTSIVTGLGGYPQLSPISTSPALNDKDQHPLFGRTVPADDSTSVPFIMYLRGTLKVKHLAVIHINDAYGSAYGQGLQAAAQVLAPDMSVQAVEIPIDASPENIQYAVQFLKRTKYAYFFGILFPANLVDAVMEEAYRQGIQGTGNHQWFFSDGVGDELVSRSFPRDSALAKSYLGTGIISASAGSTQFNPLFQKLTSALQWLKLSDGDLDYIHSILPTHSNFPGFELYDIYNRPDFLLTPGLIGPFVYDAVIAAGLAACQVYGTKPELTGEDHFKSILEQDFLGTSGHVRFDPKTGTRDVSSAFFQIQNYVIDAGRTTGTDIRLKAVMSDVFQDGAWVNLQEFVFNDGTTNVPPGVIPVEAEQNHFTPGVRAGGLSMCFVAMAIAVGLMLWTKYNEKHRVVRASQPIFLYLIGIGAIVFCSAIVPLSVDDGVASTRGCDIACNSIPWLMSSGFTLIFSALFTKTYRINQIISGAQHFKRIKVTVWQVAEPMMVLLGLNVIVLVLSTVLSPLHWEFEVETRDAFGQPLEGYGYCSTEDALPYLITLGALNLGALLVAIYQAYQARNISIQYAESQYIFSAAVSILFICCLGVPILLLAEKGDAYFFVFSAILFCCSCSILFFIFVPKIQFVHEENKPVDANESSMSFMTSSALSMGRQGPQVSGLGATHETSSGYPGHPANTMGRPLPSAITEHFSAEDDGDEEGDMEEVDDGEGVKILTGKTQEQLLRDIKILKTKLKVAWDGGRGMIRMNVPMPSDEMINFRVSGLSGGHGVRSSDRSGISRGSEAQSKSTHEYLQSVNEGGDDDEEMIREGSGFLKESAPVVASVEP